MDRLGRYEEGCPPLMRDEPSKGTDECSIRPGEAGRATWRWVHVHTRGVRLGPR